MSSSNLSAQRIEVGGADRHSLCSPQLRSHVHGRTEQHPKRRLHVAGTPGEGRLFNAAVLADELGDSEVEQLGAFAAGPRIFTIKMLSGFRSRWMTPLSVQGARGRKQLPHEAHAAPPPAPLTAAAALSTAAASSHSLAEGRTVQVFHRTAGALIELAEHAHYAGMLDVGPRQSAPSARVWQRTVCVQHFKRSTPSRNRWTASYTAPSAASDHGGPTRWLPTIRPLSELSRTVPAMMIIPL